MKVTLKDIANRLGISVATVSLVLNGRSVGFVSPETCKKVINLAKELNYVPNHSARSLVTGEFKIIGVTVGQMDECTDLIMSELQKLLNADGYQMCFCGIDSSYFSQDLSLPIINVDGIITINRSQIALPVFFKNPSAVTPCININPKIDGIKNCVSFDYLHAFKDLADHLLSCEYKKCCLVVDDTEKDKIISSSFRSAIIDSDLAGSIIDVNNNSNISYIRQMLKFHLMASERPDVFICINDYTAIALYRAMADLGISVPDAVGLILIFDSEYAKNFDVPLTAIRHCINDVTRPAWEYLKKQLYNSGNNSVADITIPYELIIRKSTIKKDKDKQI